MWRLPCLAVLVGACSEPAPPQHALLFTRTLGYRHADAIEASVPALTAALGTHGVTVEATEDPAVFASLERFGAVVFLYTTGNDLLDDAGKVELERFVRDGRGWVGVHSAADTEYAWPFYGELVVAPFAGHPDIQPATIVVEGLGHPAMSGVPSPWTATDEWYDFARNPRDVSGVQVLATIDPASYAGSAMGDDHPMIWAHERLGGRAVYTALGHVAARWQEPAFVDHVTASVRWTLRSR